MFFSVNVVAVVTVLLTISTVTAWKTSARFISMSTTNRDFLETSSIPVSSKTSYQSKILSNALLLNQLIVGAVVVNSLPANAVQGSIKTSSAEESKAAAQLVKRCLGAMDIIEAAVNKNNYEEVAKVIIDNKNIILVLYSYNNYIECINHKL